MSTIYFIFYTSTFLYLSLYHKELEKLLIEEDLQELFTFLGFSYRKSLVVQMRLTSSYLIVLTISLFYQNMFWLLLGIILYKLPYYYMKLNHLDKMAASGKEFPFYLKILEMMMQNKPVSVAISDSIDYAPPYMESRLRWLSQKIYEDPHNLSYYLTFARDFELVWDLEKIMRLLYRLSDADQEQQSRMIGMMGSISSFRMRRSIEHKFSRQAKILSFLGILPVIILSIAYMALLLTNL